MAADLGSSQISALLESVPGIANVLRSPVADAIVHLVRAAAGTVPFDLTDAEELVQYAVRRGLISADEGEQVLSEVKSRSRRGGGSSKKTSPRKGKKQAARRPVLRRPVKKKPTKRR